MEGILVMLDEKIRDFARTKKHMLLFGLLTVLALYVRYVMRGIVADDYTIFFEPWIATLREAGGGLKGLNAEFEYVDYTTPYLFILSCISICPVLNPLLLMKSVSIVFDFSAAVAVMLLVYQMTKDKTKAVLAYGCLLLAPTIVTNSAAWAQCDIIFTSFVLWSLYFMMKEKPAISMMFYGIAFAFKLQTLFLLPLYVILWMKGKVKMQHFLFIPGMYLVGIIPGLLAGQSFIDLISVYFMQAQGKMDIYALSHKFPNIYQLVGTDTFLIEYADAGVWMALAALMVMMYSLARKASYELSGKLMLEMGMLLTMCVVFFLPHMHERYAILVDVMAIAYAFVYVKKWYIPVLVILSSFAGYSIYLAKTTILPMGVYTLVFVYVMLDLGVSIYQEIWGKAKPAGQEAVHG